MRNYLDINTPLKTLKDNGKDVDIELEVLFQFFSRKLTQCISVKKFADDPIENNKDIDNPRDISPTPKKTQGGEEEIILYNDVSANRYEV